MNPSNNQNLTNTFKDMPDIETADRTTTIQRVTPYVRNQYGSDHTPPKPSRRKKYIIGGVVGLLIVVSAGLAAFIFLLYIPNLPQNVWQTGMSRTSKQVNTIVNKINDPVTKTAVLKNKLTVKGSIVLNDGTYTIDSNIKLDHINSHSILAIKGASDDQKHTFSMNAEITTKAIENARYPNIYFRLSGLSGLGLDGLIPSLRAYDGKWIAVEQDYLKQFIGDPKTLTDAQQDKITFDDILSIVKDIESVTQQYAFTNDQTKSIIQMTGFKGTEQSEGIQANHYTAKLNQNNLKNYCGAVIEKIATNSSVQKISGKSGTDFIRYMEEVTGGCDTLKSSDKEFDIWIDTKYKLFHKIRIYEDLTVANDKVRANKAQCIQDAGVYGERLCAGYNLMIENGDRFQEIGQVYKGGDQFMMFVGSHSRTNKDISKSRMELLVDMKTLAINGTIKADSDNQSVTYNVDVVVSTEPYSGSLDVEKPDGAIPIQQLLDTLNINI